MGLPSWVNNFQDVQKKNYIQTKKDAKEKLLKALNKKNPPYKGTETPKKDKKDNTENVLEDLIEYESEDEEEECGFFTKKAKIPGREDESSGPENDDFKVIMIYSWAKL